MLVNSLIGIFVLLVTASDGDESLDSRLTSSRDSRGWLYGSIADQLNRDPVIVPFGKGAIFVPAMANPLDEPPVSVWQDQHKVADGTTGQRIPVLPGRYEVRVGSGSEEQRFTFKTEVLEQQVSVVPVSWAGLAVHVVDEQMTSLRGSYELIRMDDREYIGVGFGADEEAGEPVTTWILSPGLYKIVRTGESYRARRDFATVRLLPGHLTHLMLVLDTDTGEFRGAGEVPIEELFQAHRGKMWAALIFGGDVAVNSLQNVPTAPNGRSYSFRGFLDTKLSTEIFNSPLVIRLQIEEGLQLVEKTAGTESWLHKVPWQKTQDRADLDGLYVYRLKPYLGPYLRVGGETNLVNGYEFFDEPTTIQILNADGTPRRTVNNASKLLLTRPFGLTLIKEGLGLNVRVFKSIFGETTIRAGVGARHRIVNNLLERSETPTGTEVRTYRRAASNSQVGFEGAVVAVARITRWVLVNLELDALVPFDNLDQVILEVDGTLALKLTRFASVNYVVRHLRDPTAYAERRYPLEQNVLLRFSVEIL